MKQPTKEALVGGLVFVVFVFAVVFSYGARGIAEKAAGSGYDVKATFNRIDGLGVGGEVRVGGVKVGTVTAVRLDDYYRAIVTMHIAGAVELPDDSSAAIKTDGLFGSKYMEIEPGGDSKTLADGGTIEFAQDAVIVSDLLELIIAEGKARLAKEKNDTDDQTKTP